MSDGLLAPGSLAPDFEALDCFGERVVLSGFRGKKRVVLFFFPRAFTQACTEEVRNFRDNQTLIEARGAVLIGVSVDRYERQAEFARAEGLKFHLLGDESRAISEKYGVLWPVVRIDRRATYIIGLDGRIEDVFHHERQVYRHLDDVLARLGSASPGASP